MKERHSNEQMRAGMNIQAMAGEKQGRPFEKSALQNLDGPGRPGIRCCCSSDRTRRRRRGRRTARPSSRKGRCAATRSRRRRPGRAQTSESGCTRACASAARPLAAGQYRRRRPWTRRYLRGSRFLRGCTRPQDLCTPATRRLDQGRCTRSGTSCISQGLPLPRRFRPRSIHGRHYRIRGHRWYSAWHTHTAELQLPTRSFGHPQPKGGTRSTPSPRTTPGCGSGSRTPRPRRLASPPE